MQRFIFFSKISIELFRKGSFINVLHEKNFSLFMFGPDRYHWCLMMNTFVAWPTFSVSSIFAKLFVFDFQYLSIRSGAPFSYLRRNEYYSI